MMRILLVAYGMALDRVLNCILSENSAGGVELAAIVTVPLPETGQILSRHGITSTVVRPYYELPECVHDVYYDYVFYADLGKAERLRADLTALGVSREKLVNLSLLCSERLYNISRLMRYYVHHAADFQILATGSSYAHYAIDGQEMTLPLLDFTVDSQDIFYGYALAKRILTAKDTALRAALINLAPWSCSYDMSRTTENFLCLAYALLLKETHHFPLDWEQMQAVFCQEFLHSAEIVSDRGVDLYDLNGNKQRMSHPLGVEDYLSMRSRAAEWDETRSFPATQKENEALLMEHIQLCQEHHVQPILFIAPATEIFRQYYPKRSLDQFYTIVRRVLRRTGAHLLDYFPAKGFGFAECRDVDHLNLQGSKKFTAMLDHDVMQILGQEGNRHG